MTFEVIVQPQAEADMVAASDWYSQRQSGLGDRFLDAAEATIVGLADKPYRHKARYRNSRCARLRSFPYVVVYVIREPVVYVLGVIHERRHPRVFRLRADEGRSRSPRTLRPSRKTPAAR